MIVHNRFFSNAFDPNKQDAYLNYCLENQLRTGSDSSLIAWKNRREFLQEHYTIGDPQATKTYTVEELKNMGLVGLYKKEVNVCPVCQREIPAGCCRCDGC